MKPLVMSLALAALAAPALAADPAAEIAALVTKSTAAYNKQDVKYFESALGADVVYVADDGATFASRQKVVGLFGRLFARTPPPQLEVTDVVTNFKGDVAWSRYKWKLSGGAKARQGMGVTLFAKEGADWKIVHVQNTLDGHAAAAAHKH
jgi:ketosteroid isomerase-like protein